MQKEERLQTGHKASGRPGNAQLSMLMVRGLGFSPSSQNREMEAQLLTGWAWMQCLCLRMNN